MKVKELIELLSKMKPDAEIKVWGYTTDDGEGTISVEGYKDIAVLKEPN